MRYARCVDLLDDLYAGLADGSYARRLKALGRAPTCSSSTTSASARSRSATTSRPPPTRSSTSSTAGTASASTAITSNITLSDWGTLPRRRHPRRRDPRPARHALHPHRHRRPELPPARRQDPRRRARSDLIPAALAGCANAEPARDRAGALPPHQLKAGASLHGRAAAGSCSHVRIARSGDLCLHGDQCGSLRILLTSPSTNTTGPARDGLCPDGGSLSRRRHGRADDADGSRSCRDWIPRKPPPKPGVAPGNQGPDGSGSGSAQGAREGVGTDARRDLGLLSRCRRRRPVPTWCRRWSGSRVGDANCL